MDTYRYSVHPPPITPYNQVYQQYQPYLGTSHHQALYQSHNMTPYLMTNGYLAPHSSQMYLQHTAPSVHPIPGTFAHQSFIAEEPSCFEGFLENICCCFRVGTQTHQDITYKYEMRRRRLMEKEGMERMLQDEKIQKENQRQMEKQQLKQLAMNTADNKTSTANISVPKSTVATTTTS